MANFVRHESCPKCGSTDNLAIYDDGSYYCWSQCGHKKLSKDFLSENNLLNKSKPKVRSKEKMQQTQVSTKSSAKAAIDDDLRAQIKNSTIAESNGYRGIKDYVTKFFGVRTLLDEEDNVQAVYYPTTEDSQLVGYKKRLHPKEFSSIGRTGATCELFGQFRFNNSTAKTCLIVGGEHDQLAAYQILRDYQLNNDKSHYDPPVVVSPTVGETGCAKQLAQNYSFFDKFDKIVIAFDNDAAGEEAVGNAVYVLPKGKVFIMKMRYKDPNKYLDEGKEREFISDFYNSKRYVPAGIVGSENLLEKVVEYASLEKIPLPPFMVVAQEMLAGGITLPSIVNIGAGSGIGKTSIVNELIYYWLFNSPYKIGIVTMELTVGQYGEMMLSRHLQKKIGLISDKEKKLELLDSEIVKQKAKELFQVETGESRWLLVDDRDGTLEDLQDIVEELVISCGCKVIVLDPLQDLLDGLSSEEQAVFMKWQKSIIKSHNVAFININHIRKSGDTKNSASTGAFITEEDFAGSSTIFKSASVNILLMRDKYNEDAIIRNTTKAVMSKNRICGVTGPCGEFYYDNESHTLHDFATYFKNRSQIPDYEKF